MKKLVILALAIWAFGAEARADEYLTEAQAKALFTDKTFDGLYVPKDKIFKAYEAPDGAHVVLRPNGKKDKGRKWMVNDKGQHCTTGKKWDGWRCSHVKDAGNGEYHKVNGRGKHTHTLTNFRAGNQL